MLDLALLVVFPLLALFAGAADFFTMTIPNRVALLLLASFPAVAYAAGLGAEAQLMHAAAGGIVLAVTFTLFAFGLIGGGDAKLTAALAVWLGFGSLLDFLFVAACVGGALSLALLVMRQVPLPAFSLRWSWLETLHDKKTGVPYGVALAAGALAVYPHSAVWQAALAG
jgi:prepilin peptidase CpaA